ncbi:histone acetyltransferase type B catalytic subunit [Parasteatoda tepidariorum]|uniref:histone acetyltransferase type B catalytic subunit n=1 Tax=Parasteatoda tepidariorum TaxID=114398 RepID=UPI001C7237EC|nr:histone acetyltransferase type B catalytic subunit-like [Parasteatoda tepidariorum]
MAVKRKYTGDCLDQYVCSANEVIKLKFVRNPEDIEDDKNSFPPEYTHQFFGDSENIFGYIGLQVNFLYSACRLLPLFQMSYREKVKSAHTGGVEADDVYKIVTDKLEMEISQDLDALTNALPKESNFRPFGELLSSFSVENDEKEEFYKIYRADNETPGFLDYHQRMQTLVLWLIDAASYIDEEDEKWDFFVLHQHCKDGDDECYPFVGYATVYRYYAYPCKLRPRISQMLVLPQYQKQGLGTRLLEAINNCYIKDSDVIDITVEDPSEEFVRIRDVIDSKNCQTLPAFSKENLLKGFSKAMTEAAKDNFKINKKQARRVYEILRLKNTNLDDKNEYKAYRLAVKNRLNIPFQREKLDMEKLQKTLTPDELKAAVDPIPREQRIEQLEHMYTELEEKYKHVIDRLNELELGK